MAIKVHHREILRKVYKVSSVHINTYITESTMTEPDSLESVSLSASSSSFCNMSDQRLFCHTSALWVTFIVIILSVSLLSLSLSVSLCLSSISLSLSVPLLSVSLCLSLCLSLSLLYLSFSLCSPTLSLPC